GLGRGERGLRAVGSIVAPAAPGARTRWEHLVAAPRFGAGPEQLVSRPALTRDVLGAAQLTVKRRVSVLPADDLAGRQVVKLHLPAIPAQHPSRRPSVQRQRERRPRLVRPPPTT